MTAIRPVLVVVTLASHFYLTGAYAILAPDSAPVFDRDLKVKAVGRLILSKLGLEQPPVVSEDQLKSVTETQQARYDLTAKMNERKMVERTARRQVEEEYYTPRVTTLEMKELQLQPCSVYSQCSCKMQSKYYKLDTEELSFDAIGTITTAFFQIYYDPVASTKSEEILISAYQLNRTCCNALVHPDTVLLDARKVTSDHACFVQFDITSAVKSWVADKSTNHGLEIEVSAGQCGQSSYLKLGHAAQFSGYLQTSTTDRIDYRPVLFVSSSHPMASSIRGRRRRQTLDEDYCDSLEPGQPNCCIYDFELNLVKDLGWNWIVQPRTIRLNQCTGECPPTWAEEANYTQAINEYRLLNPSGSVSPCCSPGTYGDVTIFYFNGIYPWPVIGTMTDLTVTSCVCS